MVSLELLVHRSIRYPQKGLTLKNSYGVQSELLELVFYSFLVLELLSRTEELAKVEFGCVFFSDPIAVLNDFVLINLCLIHVRTWFARRSAT